MRIMALDVGDKKIGVALSDPLNLVAQPLKVIKRGNREIEEIKRIVKEKNVSKIILGLPLNKRGDETEQSEKIKNFAKKLKNTICASIEFYDERFTTKEAEKILISAKLSREKRKKFLDIVSSVIILQGYLSRYKK